MNNEMIERIAKAMDLADNEVDVWDVKSDDGDGYGYLGKNDYRKMAKAAIKAMREPTEKMMVEMERAEPQLECFLEKEKSPSYLVWIAAIDAIIND